MKGGTLEYETAQGKHSFPAGSGDLINTGVLHRSQPLDSAVPTIQKPHIVDASLLYGNVGGRIHRKYFAPVLTDYSVKIISLMPDDSAHTKLLELIRSSFLLEERKAGYELELRAMLSGI